MKLHVRVWTPLYATWKINDGLFFQCTLQGKVGSFMIEQLDINFTVGNHSNMSDSFFGDIRRVITMGHGYNKYYRREIPTFGIDYKGYKGSGTNIITLYK